MGEARPGGPNNFKISLLFVNCKLKGAVMLAYVDRGLALF